MAKKRPAAGTTEPAPAPAEQTLKNYSSHTAAKLRRSQISLAEYNPRFQSPHARKKLRGVLKQVGLVEPLVVNRRTVANGFAAEDDGSYMLVGGHQRIGAMDEMSGFDQDPERDYEIDVALIEVDEPTEKAVNMALNNPGIQGGWDPALLESLISDPSIPIEKTGFEKVDLQLLLSDEGLASIFQDQQAAEQSTVDAMNQIKADSLEAKKAEKAVTNPASPAADRVEGSSVPQHTVPTSFAGQAPAPPLTATVRAADVSAEQFAASLAAIRR